jgi:aspartate-semialdehyde dehydrogenase
MLKVGFVGFRGMVGSVLMQRMLQENDFANIEPHFFSETQYNKTFTLDNDSYQYITKDANSLDDLLKLDVIVSTQGADYTQKIFPQLTNNNYAGYFIDASSYLRMHDKSLIFLDPINYDLIIKSIKAGCKIYSGANCSASLLLLALHGLFANDLIEWVHSSTYQAVSGKGIKGITELLRQYSIMMPYTNQADNTTTKLVDINLLTNQLQQMLTNNQLTNDIFHAPIANNILPWIDVDMHNGQTKEEWKFNCEINKILGNTPNTLKIDGMCVRVPTIRAHSQSVVVKLKNKSLSLDEIRNLLSTANPWIKIVENERTASINQLTPLIVQGKLDIVIGRIHKLNFGEDYLSLFTVGDQLLWGAAEPIRRMLNIIVTYHEQSAH